MRHLRFGVEVEMVGLSAKAAQTAVYRYFDGAYDHLGRTWSVVADASIPDGFELRSPPLAYADLAVLQEVFQRLRQAGARRSAQRAGIHVHVDARGLSVAQLSNLVALWTSDEALLRHLLNVHPYRTLRYCQSTAPFAHRLAARPANDEAALRELWYDGTPRERAEETRHTGLNLHSYFIRRTVEFRAFPSTNSRSKLGVFVTVALAYAAVARDTSCGVPLSLTSSPRTSDEALGAIDSLLARLGLTAPEFAVVRDVMVENALRPPEQEPRTMVTFFGPRTEFDGGSFRQLLDEMIDNGFLDEPGVREHLRRDFARKPGIAADLRAARAADPESFSRRVIEFLAERGVGEIVVKPETPRGTGAPD